MSEENKNTRSVDNSKLSKDDPFVKYPFLNDMMGLLEEIKKESDKGKVLISCSLLDEICRRMLVAFLVDCDQTKKLVEGFNAPLGSFSTRINALYAFGLISDNEFKELEIMRKIRNRFAHEIYVSFEDQQIKDLMKNFKFKAKGKPKVPLTPSELFTQAVTGLILWIGHRPVDIKSQQSRTTLANTR